MNNINTTHSNIYMLLHTVRQALTTVALLGNSRAPRGTHTSNATLQLILLTLTLLFLSSFLSSFYHHLPSLYNFIFHFFYFCLFVSFLFVYILIFLSLPIFYLCRETSSVYASRITFPGYGLFQQLADEECSSVASSYLSQASSTEMR